MLPKNIGSDMEGLGKIHDLDQSYINLLPYDPCKDAQEFSYGTFLEKGGSYNKNYLYGVLDDP